MPIDRAGNTFAQARSLGISAGKKVFRDRIDQSDRKDFYTFTLTKSSNIKLHLNKLKGNLDLNLFDAQGSLLAKSRNKKTKGEKIKQTLDAGTYYIQVKRKGGNSKYKLKTLLREVSTEAKPDPTIPSIDIREAPEETAEEKAKRVAFIDEVLALTNAEREKEDLRPLSLNQQLSKAAQIQSEDLALGDFFAHTSPDGVDLADRLEAGGYESYDTAGENIAAGQITAEQVVQEWMNSPGHRDNILEPAFKELGVGYYFLAQDTGEVNYNHYWTQTFGTPTE